MLMDMLPELLKDWATDQHIVRAAYPRDSVLRLVLWSNLLWFQTCP